MYLIPDVDMYKIRDYAYIPLRIALIVLLRYRGYYIYCNICTYVLV